MVDGDIGAQVQQVFDNLAAVARAAGCDLGRDAVKITVFLVDLAHFGLVNEVMSGMLPSPFRPAPRSRWRDCPGARR